MFSSRCDSFFGAAPSLMRNDPFQFSLVGFTPVASSWSAVNVVVPMAVCKDVGGLTNAPPPRHYVSPYAIYEISFDPNLPVATLGAARLGNWIPGVAALLNLSKCSR